jgi:hypothetical protein
MAMLQLPVLEVASWLQCCDLSYLLVNKFRSPQAMQMTGLDQMRRKVVE